MILSTTISIRLAEVEDVRHLVFRFQRLQSLEAAIGSVDFGRMQALEVGGVKLEGWRF